MSEWIEPPKKRSILASHSLTRRVLHSLDQVQPQTTHALSQKLKLHQSSVSHKLKELAERDLVVKKGKSYCLINAGIIEKNTLEWTGKTLRCIQDHKDFILSHDISGIPASFQVTMGVIGDCWENIENDPDLPNRAQEIIIPLLKEGKYFLVASSALVPLHQLTVVQAVREGGYLQAITTEKIIEELRRNNYALKDELLRSRIELFGRSKINLHLIVTESCLFLALPRLDGSYDLENIIVSKDPGAVEWGRILFYHFLSGSEKIDLNTLDLPLALSKQL